MRCRNFPCHRHSPHMVAAERSRPRPVRRRFHYGLSYRRALAAASLLALLVACSLDVTTAYAQACSNTPGVGDRVECKEDAASNADIDILLEGVDIDATGNFISGVHAEHLGNGDIDIDVTYSLDESKRATSSTIDTSGIQGYAIYGHHTGSGGIDISVTGARISTTNKGGHGPYALHEGTGGMHFDVRATYIDTTGKDSHGVYAKHQNTADDGDITIVASLNRIVTEGESAHGIRGTTFGSGDVTLNTSYNTITTKGIYTTGIYGYHRGDGDIFITSQHDTITTESTSNSAFTDGIGAWHQIGNGDVEVDVVGGSIESRGYASNGITGGHGQYSLTPVSTQGQVDIEVKDTVITMQGEDAYGIYGFHAGSGAIRIVTKGSQSITTTNGHGIVANHNGTGEDRRIDITVGGTIDTQGTDAQGVRVGRLNDTGAPERVAALDKDGYYRKQTVRVNGQVTGEAAGVFLAGGGRVVIGPRGSIGASSGIAILATGDTPVDGGNPIKPKLHVSMNLDGRPVAQVIRGGGWIINDGRTTIEVNRVTLHDGVDGVVLDANADPVKVPNGAFDVAIRDDGLTVTNRTTPGAWMFSTRSTSTIAGRDFSGTDFTETVALTCPSGQVGTPPNCMPPPPSGCPPGQVGTPPNCMPPPPPSCPPGQVGTPPNCTEPEPEQPMFMEEYAPRAAVYEALPDFLLRLTGQGPARTCGSVPDEPVWVRFAGGQGSYEADRSTTGATYNLERFETEGGLSAAFNDTTKGWVSVRHVWGAAGIGSPTGGGQIDVRGLGSSVGGAWQSATGAYAKGCFSYMAYTVDFASNQRGLLKAGTDGRAYTLDVEAGRRFALTEQVQLTPRVWVVGSRVSVDSFTDAVDARVSFADANRIIGGLGFVADTTRPWGEGAFVLRGSVDVERLLSGVETRVQVSGEQLSAVATEHSLRFGLNGTYRQGRFSIGAEVAARQELGSDDSEYAGFLNLGIRF